MSVLSQRLVGVLAAAGLTIGCAALGTPAAHANGVDSFYTYDGSAPLSSMAPGTVLKTRTSTYHLDGMLLPLKAVQILYRTTNARGQAVANVTSVLQAPGNPLPGQMVAYSSFYDSLNPEDSPSRLIAQDKSFGQENIFLDRILWTGHSVVISDVEGQQADFAAGPEYGMNTLDSVRAVSQTKAAGFWPNAKVGMLGYSGGAIGTQWAASLAPSYAPDVNKRLVGYTEGGLLVDPAHNLGYVSGAKTWAGIAPMAIVGVSRSYDLDFAKYLSDSGIAITNKLQNAIIGDVTDHYDGLTFASLVKPQYANPDSIPEFVTAVNRINLGQQPAPTVPGQIFQGTNGESVGSPGDKPGIGDGDGVMVAGDVRTLARKYCAAGQRMQYAEFASLDHVGTGAVWMLGSMSYLNARFLGLPAPSNCSSIAAGNPLDPEQPVAPAAG